jgi:hypothetical protein
LDREIVVLPNPRVYSARKGLLKNVYDELKMFDKSAQLDDEFLETLNFITKVLYEIKGE